MPTSQEEYNEIYNQGIIDAQKLIINYLEKSNFSTVARILSTEVNKEKITTLDEMLESRKFYGLCQLYRCTPPGNQKLVLDRFESIKFFIKKTVSNLMEYK